MVRWDYQLNAKLVLQSKKTVSDGIELLMGNIKTSSIPARESSIGQEGFRARAWLLLPLPWMNVCNIRDSMMQTTSFYNRAANELLNPLQGRLCPRTNVNLPLRKRTRRCPTIQLKIGSSRPDFVSGRYPDLRVTMSQVHAREWEENIWNFSGKDEFWNPCLETAGPFGGY